MSVIQFVLLYGTGYRLMRLVKRYIVSTLVQVERCRALWAVSAYRTVERSIVMLVAHEGWGHTLNELQLTCDDELRDG